MNILIEKRELGSGGDGDIRPADTFAVSMDLNTGKRHKFACGNCGADYDIWPAVLACNSKYEPFARIAECPNKCGNILVYRLLASENTL